MTHSIRFALALHNHQPVGNFDHVVEQAYHDAYLPFLDVFEKFPSLRLSLHTSGSLMQWLDEHQGGYLDRLAALVCEGRIEIVGGAYYEPILTMIPSRDRIGQIQSYTAWLRDRLGADVQGMWIAERVWEQSLVSDLVDAGARYSIVDDFHFKSTGLAQDQLNGYYTTEDDGRLLSVFPGSEPLRYTIPFAAPSETIDYLRQIAERTPDAVAVFADDGEKFGTWPGTNRHVYGSGWLEQFFGLLAGNQDWINVTTLTEIVDHVAPRGTIYLPDGSYREMTEWVLPAAQQADYVQARGELESDPRWPLVAAYVRGGFWRNFKTKYPEASEMYARMMMVSRRLQDAIDSGRGGEVIDHAREELYRGQCNCAYWHGAFGGIYLPHLRNAIYKHLIAADNLLDQAEALEGPRIEAVTDDFNLDARQEVYLNNDQLAVLIAPASGGQMYGLDVRSICHNLLSTLARRPEAYHRKVLAGATRDANNTASIHDRVVFKQEGLDQRLQYDDHPRRSLLDRFLSHDATLGSITAGTAKQHGDFLEGAYETRIRRNPDRIQVQMIRDGVAEGKRLRITKGVTLAAGSATLEIAYLIEGLPQDHPLHFAVEMNFAGLPAGADDRFFHIGQTQQSDSRLGQLGSQLELHDVQSLGLCDEYLGIDVVLGIDRPTGIWTFPIETVSQSEGGFELVHQSVVVMPHWLVTGDAKGRWSTRMNLQIDTALAESRMETSALAVTS